MKIKNLFIFISLLVLSLFMITSCGEDNKEDENNNQGNGNPVTEEGLSKDEFVALLVNQGNNCTMAMKQNGQTAEVSMTIKFDAKYRDKELVSFKASSENSTGSLNMYGEEEELEFDEDNIIVNGSKTSYTYKNGKITLEEDGTKMVFEKK